MSLNQMRMDWTRIEARTKNKMRPVESEEGER